MLAPRQVVPLVLVVLAAAALVYTGWTALARPDVETCDACGRPVHLASRVDGISAGGELTFCCAACAVRAKDQEGRPIRLTRVFAFESGEELRPDDAIGVVGSDVNLCMRDHVLMDSHRGANGLQFDRCSPSVLAFDSTVAAETFQRHYGGVVTPIAELGGALQ